MKRTFLILVAVLAVSLAGSASEPLKILSYNLRFGELATVEQLGDFVASQQADFVALQECDWATKRDRAPHQHGVKFVSEIAHRAGMFGLYGKAINYKGGYYGVGILSRYPIIKSERVLLPQKPKTEQRTLLVATAELPSGDLLTFVSTHLEVSSSEARMEQVEFINRYFDEWPYPVILVGDMNAEPHTKECPMLPVHFQRIFVTILHLFEQWNLVDRSKYLMVQKLLCLHQLIRMVFSYLLLQIKFRALTLILVKMLL